MIFLVLLLFSFGVLACGGGFEADHYAKNKILFEILGFSITFSVIFAANSLVISIMLLKNYLRRFNAIIFLIICIIITLINSYFSIALNNYNVQNLLYYSILPQIIIPFIVLLFYFFYANKKPSQ